MKYIERIIEEVRVKDADQKEFNQAVEEVLHSIEPIFDKHPEYEKMADKKYCIRIDFRYADGGNRSGGSFAHR